MGSVSRKLTIRTFEAVNDMAACLDFSEGYAQVLTEQGISNAYINSHRWVTTLGIYGVLAEHQGKVVGGIMLWLPIQEKRFPFEDVIGTPKKGTKNKLEVNTEDSAELFALWHSNSVAGWGLSYVLLKAGLALASKLNIQKTYYLVVDYNMRLSDKLGFETEKKDGMPVHFTLNAASISTKVYLCYYTTQDKVAEREKAAIKELAESNHVTKLESVLNGTLEIEYFIE